MAQYSSVSTDYGAFGMRPVRHPGYSPTISYYEASTCVSSNLIKGGMPVAFDTVAASASMRIVRAPSSAGAAGDVMSSTNVLGVAIESDTSDGSTAGVGINRKIGVVLATDHQEFLGFLEGDLPSASSIVGLQRALSWDSSRNIYAISSTNSTAADASIVITGLPPSDNLSSIGDTNGPVYFKFISTRTAPVLGRG